MNYITLTILCLLGLTFNNFIWIWLMMTMSTMIMTSNMSSSEGKIKFFLFQEIPLSLFVWGLLIMTWYLMPIMSLMVKMGVPPAHSWLITLITDFSWDSLILFLSVYKILPIWLIIQMTDHSVMAIFMMTALFSSLLMFYSLSMKVMFFLSSNNVVSWLFLLTNTSTTTTLTASISYFLLIVFIVKLNHLLDSMNGLNMSILIIIMGTPLLLMFFWKWMLFSTISSASLTMILLLIMGMIINMLAYMRQIILLFHQTEFSHQLFNPYLVMAVALITLLLWLP